MMSNMDAIPLDLLEVILLLVAWPVFLVRAASTCRQWRRVIARPDFLRRFRCLHRPPVAGYYYDTTRRFSPSSWWPSGVDGRRFALDFLPGLDPIHDVWRLRDSRGSLLLLDHYSHRNASWGMVVCEPVTRRFHRIPHCRGCYNTSFLLDGDDAQHAGGGISLSSFRILCLLHYGKHTDARVFTWGDSSWREATSIDSGSMTVIGVVAMGSIHWYAGRRKVVTQDQCSAEFSSFTLPAGTEDWDSLANQHRLAVTAGRDGRVRVVAGVAGGDMKVFVRVLTGGGSCEWVLEKRITLSFMAMQSRLPWRGPWYFAPVPISNHRTGVVLIVTTRMSLPQEPTTPLMFRLDIETMAVERMPDPNKGTAYPLELPWPPVFRACTDRS